MGLTRTVTPLARDDDITAAAHRELLLGLDELIAARFNSRTWLAFTCDPQLPLGDVFQFGATLSNLQDPGFGPYDISEETPDPPIAGDVLDWDEATKVVWVSGGSDYVTLNRKTVLWKPLDAPPEDPETDWWLGLDRAERFEPLRIADILVEGYEDPVAGDTAHFTFRVHWDRHGCIRVHNGNRFAVTLQFEGGTQADVEIPAYGIVCGRRPSPNQPFEFATFYLPLARDGDPAKFEPQNEGAFAASLELAQALMQEVSTWIRYGPGLDMDSTSREQGAFTGSAPQSSDRLWDWLIHRGKILSVVLDRRDGTTTIQELTWNGFTSLPDPAWSGVVDVTVDGTDITFESAVTPPAGATDEEWEHDLIPVTTNLLTGLAYGPLIALTDGPATITTEIANPGVFPPGCYALSLGWIGITESSITAAAPYTGGADYVVNTAGFSDSAFAGVQLDKTLSTAYPAPGEGAAISSSTITWTKRCTAITGHRTATWDVSGYVMAMTPISSLGRHPLAFAELGSNPAWAFDYPIAKRAAEIPFATVGEGPRRFVAWAPRAYQGAGEVVGGSAVYEGHPQDQDLLGTPDGLGGPLGWSAIPVETSSIQIEWSRWIETPTSYGRAVFRPADVLHVIAQNIATSGWWADNRDRMFAGTLNADEQLVSWRAKRTVEGFNNLALAVNRVQEVYKATIHDLHRDPLPSPVLYHPPWSGWAVPYGWIAGRTDADGQLADWCAAWGIDLQTILPNIAALRSRARFVIYAKGAGSTFQGWFIGTAAANTSIIYSEYAENGETYNTHSSWSPASQRALFGGSGADPDYAWIDYSDCAAVFNPLGVAVPPMPVGERYEPRLQVPTGITQLAGNSPPGSGTAETYRADITAVYRLPGDQGTWVRIIRPGDGFRLIDAEGGNLRRLAYTVFADGESPPFEWEVWEVGESLNAQPFVSVFEPFDPDIEGANPQSPLMSPLLSGIPAFPALSRIDSQIPLLIAGTPGTYYDWEWVEPIPSGEPETSTFDDLRTLSSHVPDSGGWNWRECVASDAPITPSKVRGWGWPDWPCFHLDFVARPGVLRESG